MKIGIIVAVEIDSLIEKFGISESAEKIGDYQILKYVINKSSIYVITSGVGEIAAASATQLLISKYNVQIILNYGVVGSLSERFNAQDTCLVSSVVHYDYDLSEVDDVVIGKYENYESVYLPIRKEMLKISQNLKLPTAICASGDKFIGDIEKKKYLNKLYGADICDMESAGIILTCDKNHIPCLLLKTVADSLTGKKEEFYKEKRNSSDICIEILDEIIKLY